MKIKGSHDQNLLQSIPSNIYYQLKKRTKEICPSCQLITNIPEVQGLISSSGRRAMLEITIAGNSNHIQINCLLVIKGFEALIIEKLDSSFWLAFNKAPG